MHKIINKTTKINLQLFRWHFAELLPIKKARNKWPSTASTTRFTCTKKKPDQKNGIIAQNIRQIMFYCVLVVNKKSTVFHLVILGKPFDIYLCMFSYKIQYFPGIFLIVQEFGGVDLCFWVRKDKWLFLM